MGPDRRAGDSMRTMVTIKTPTSKEEYFVADYSFGDYWLSLTLDDNTRVEVNVTYVEWIQIGEYE